jgi:hypothetical protein
MIPETLQRLIDRWLDGDLSGEEEHQLRQSMESTPGALEYLVDRSLLHAMLATSVASVPPPMFVELDAAAKFDVSSNASIQRPSPWFAQTWLWVASMTVACLLMIPMLFYSSVVAGPSDLVQKTLAEYRAAADRCYAVHVEMENRPGRNRFRGRAGSADSKLWVRGDGFVQIFESSGTQLVWGRNLEGSVWFTIAGRSAAIFRANEIPEVLQDLCDLRTLDVSTLLESLLRDYELKYTDRNDDVHTILASPRPGDRNSKYGTVEIEIDPRSRLVRRVSLERLNDKRSIAVISFYLQEVRQREESFYEVESHLQSDAEVLQPGFRLGKRSELLREFLSYLRSSNAWRIK